MMTMRGRTSASTSSASFKRCGRAVRRRVTTPAAEFFLAFTLLSVCCDACDICDGTRGQRSLADGSIDEVLELSAKGLEIAVAEHPLVLVLLYAPKWFMDERERRLLAAFGQAAQVARREALPAALARVDIDQFPSVAAALQVPRAALPTLRLLRGSVGYGSEWRGGRGAGDLVTYLREEAATPTAVRTLDDDAAAAAFAALSTTRVRGRLWRPASVDAFAQVAATFRGAIKFAMEPRAADDAPVDAPESGAAPAAPATPAGEPPPPPGGAPAPVEAETVVLLRERSPTMEGEMPELVMPVVGGALEPHALRRWVRWAALPTVHQLTSESAKAFLHEGSAGVLFVRTGGAPKQREYVVRRLRRVAAALAEDGAPAPLWLLWAERSDPVHARLREKLGLPPVETAAEAAAADASDFAIARMGGGHVLQTYAMSAPFSYDALREHARAYCAGELRADIHWRKELRERWPSVAAAVAAVAALLYYRWRGRRREKELKTD